MRGRPIEVLVLSEQERGVLGEAGPFGRPPFQRSSSEHSSRSAGNAIETALQIRRQKTRLKRDRS